MKYLELVVLSVLAVSGTTLEDELVIGETGWYVPQLNGSFVWVDSDEFDVDEGGQISTNPVTFYLYTRENPESAQTITASNYVIDASNFNPENPTRISIHGWNSSMTDYINHGVRDAWLEKGEYNFIFVDWELARSEDYANSTFAVALVGKKCAALVEFLIKNYNLDLNALEIIGHNLGAHVAGLAGKNIQSGQVHTIIGLDPALPLFKYNKPHQRLSSEDAEYVKTIQTNGGKLDSMETIGNSDFYMNGVKTPPICYLDPTHTCCHSRSIEHYVEELSVDNFISIKYEDSKQGVAGKFNFRSIRKKARGKSRIFILCNFKMCSLTLCKDICEVDNP